MLSLAEIQERLSELNDWELNMDSLEKEFIFKSTNDAKIFLNKLYEISEKLAHFPVIIADRLIVNLKLSTRKEGIGEKDFELAKEIDKIQI